MTVTLRGGAAQDDAGTPSMAPLIIDDTVIYRPWTNERKPAEVVPEAEFSPYVTPDDEVVSALDVLYIINYINQHGSGPLPPPPASGPPGFYDVNGSGDVTPLDVLLVINYVNSRVGGAGESESIGIPWAARALGSGAQTTAEVEGEAAANDQPALANSAAAQVTPTGFVRRSFSSINDVHDRLYVHAAKSDFGHVAVATDAALAAWGNSQAVQDSLTTYSRIVAARRAQAHRSREAVSGITPSFGDAVDHWLAGWDGDLSSLTQDSNSRRYCSVGGADREV